MTLTQAARLGQAHPYDERAASPVRRNHNVYTRGPTTPRGQSTTLPYSVTQEEAEKDERNYDPPGQRPPGTSDLTPSPHSGPIARSGRLDGR